MPNFTPTRFKPLYEIYPGKIGAASTPEQGVASIGRMAAGMGRPLDYARGDSLKAESHADLARTPSTSY